MVSMENAINSPNPLGEDEEEVSLREHMNLNRVLRLDYGMIEPALDGLWLEYRNPLYLTKIEHDEIWKPNLQVRLDDMEIIRKRIGAHVVDWNMPTFDAETEEEFNKPLPLPKDDPTVIGRLPAVIYEPLATTLMQASSHMMEMTSLAARSGFR